MKSIFSKLLVALFLLFGNLTFAQKHEFDIGYRIGIDAGNNTSALRTVYDQGLTLKFKYKIWEKANLFAVLGYNKSRTKYSIHDEMFGLNEGGFGYNTLNINRHGVQLGLSKRFVFNKFSMSLGASLVTRTREYLELSHKISGGDGIYEGTSRSFTFETSPYLRNSGFEFDLQLMYDLSERFSLRTGLSLSTGHYFKFYSSTSFTDQNKITSSTYPQKYFKEDNFLFFNAGLVFKL